MGDYPDDIYTEPSDVDPHTLKNLGPLTNMAGVWEGVRGLDVNPKPNGPERQVFVERIELQPIDPQDQRHLLEPVPRARLQDRRVPDQGHDR